MIENENTRWCAFTSVDDVEAEDTILVLPRCPMCMRFIPRGKVSENLLGDVRLSGWVCKRDGEVQPDWMRYP